MRVGAARRSFGCAGEPCAAPDDTMDGKKRNDPQLSYSESTVEGHFMELLVSNIIGYLAFVK